MSKELPQLPAFLTQPLVCPRNRCNYRGRPLPPVFTELASLLPKWFLGRCVDGLRIHTLQNTSRSGSRSTINAGIIQRLRADPRCTPKKVLQASKLYASTAPTVESHTSMRDLFIPTVIKNQLKETILEAMEEFSTGCLHDFLDPAGFELWEAFSDEPHEREYELQELDEVESPSLADQVAAAITRGELDDRIWGQRAEWERELMYVQAKEVKLLTDANVKESRTEFEKLGYREVLERPGAIEGLLCLFLSAKSHSFPDILSFDSPQLAQFYNFCQSPAARRKRVLASTLRSTVSAADSQSRQFTASPSGSSTTLSSLPSSSSPSLPDSSSTAYDQFERLDSSSDLPHIVRFVPPRFCPPDRCSGVEPKFEEYQTIDRLLTELMRIGMRKSSFLTMEDRAGMIRARVLERTISGLTSLECESPAEQRRLIASMEDHCQQFVRKIEQETSNAVFEGEGQVHWLSRGLRTINRHQLGHDCVPCVCSLSHLTDGLALIKQTFDSRYLNDVDASRGKLASKPRELRALEKELEDAVRAGRLVADCWTGDRWKTKVARIVKLLDIPLFDCILSQHEIMTLLSSRLPSIISPARLIEEMGSFPPDWTDSYPLPPTLGGFAAVVDDQAIRYLTSSKAVKLRGDALATSQEFFDRTAALDSYQLATLIDPSNFEARLNSATVRLRLADQNENPNLNQWSRAIYDCSAALYYGSTSFKAYYRRGYALTRLSMWDKAILDFDQALLIDPDNVLVERCLAAAKRKSVVSF